MNIQLVNLKKQYAQLKNEIERVVNGVLASGSFILGEQVSGFEKECASFFGARFAVGVASGTDALELSLRALGIKENDEVITTPFTFIATAETIARVGALPVFADIEPDTYNISSVEIKKKVTAQTKAIIPVHLFGQPCDMEGIVRLSKEYNLKIIEDCCQAIGAEYRGKKAGLFGDTGCFSFFPSKNLSTSGDGGMIITNNEESYNLLRMLRVHGSRDKYFHVYPGLNSRLDELHAAILRVKLPHLNEWNQSRRRNAQYYNDCFKEAQLGEVITTPVEQENLRHVYNIYAVCVDKRDALKTYLQEHGIQTGVHYPLGLHLQEVYKRLQYKRGDFPVTEKVASRVLSLPMYPELEKTEIRYIVDTIKSFYRR